jgi:hypothetical protein
VRGLAATVAALALFACSPAQDGQSVDAAATRPEATLILEPSTLRIGDISSLEIAVATPPDHRVLPYETPEVPGLWILDATAVETERGVRRWMHRTRIRVRPRELGLHEWPATRVSIESSEGARFSLELPGSRVEVVSILPEIPDRVAPFGFLSPEAVAGNAGLGALSWAAVGALVTLLAMALIAAARGWRARRSASEPGGPAAPTLDLWQWVEAQFASADQRLEREPRAAANAAARGIRLYVAGRFGTRTQAATTPELEATAPPLAVRSRWPYFLRILRVLDDVRFRSLGEQRDDHSEDRDRIRAALEEARRFVEDSVPPELRS